MYIPFCILSHYPASDCLTNAWKVQYLIILIFSWVGLYGLSLFNRDVVWGEFRKKGKVKRANVVPVLDQFSGHTSWQTDKILLSLLRCQTINIRNRWGSQHKFQEDINSVTGLESINNVDQPTVDRHKRNRRLSSGPFCEYYWEANVRWKLQVVRSRRQSGVFSPCTQGTKIGPFENIEVHYNKVIASLPLGSSEAIISVSSAYGRGLREVAINV